MSTSWRHASVRLARPVLFCSSPILLLAKYASPSTPREDRTDWLPGMGEGDYTRPLREIDNLRTTRRARCRALIAVAKKRCRCPEGTQLRQGVQPCSDA